MINVLVVILSTHHILAYQFNEKKDKLMIFLLTVEMQLSGKSFFLKK